MIRIERPACPHHDALENGNYSHPTNKAALREASHGKCMYCESHIDHTDFAHIEHIKPKAAGKFPELTYEWTNLGYACAICNNSKSDSFDLDTPYIDPYAEEPSDYLLFAGAFVFPRNGSERGELTIQDTKLNRAELLEKRKARIDAFEKAISAAHRTANAALRDGAIAALKDEAAPDKEYSLCVGTFLRLHE